MNMKGDYRISLNIRVNVSVNISIERLINIDISIKILNENSSINLCRKVNTSYFNNIGINIVSVCILVFIVLKI